MKSVGDTAADVRYSGGAVNEAGGSSRQEGGGGGQPLTFGGLLREYRVAAGLTQEALAERAGISVRSVSDLERGLYQVPHRDTVARLAEALELSATDTAVLEATIIRQRGPSVSTPPFAGASPSSTGAPIASSAAPITSTLAQASGVVAFLIADLDVLEQSDSVARHDGRLLLQTTADNAAIAVFPGSAQAIAAALELQTPQARMALHTGAADVRDGVYYGSALSRCARMRNLASPGQCLISEVVAQAMDSLLARTRLQDLGEQQLSEHGRPERLFGLVAPGQGRDFPPLRAALSLSKHYETVLRAMFDGRLVFFAGDGVNVTRTNGSGPRPPAATDLARSLARSFDYPPEAPTELSRVAQYVSIMAGSGPLYEELHSLLQANFTPTPFHQFVATLPAALARTGELQKYPLVVTTTYDHGLEHAFDSAGEPYDLVSYIAEGEERGRFVHRAPDGRSRVIDKPNKYLGISDQRTTILKVHGAVDLVNAEMDSFVVTEDDFLDYLVGADISLMVPVTVAARLRRSHFLFLGYGLRDWNMRVILRRIWGEQRLSYKSWAVYPVTPEPMENSLWRDRGVDVLDIRLDDYVAGLQSRVESMAAGDNPV